MTNKVANNNNSRIFDLFLIALNDIHTLSSYRPDGGDAVHRDTVREYKAHDTNHAPYESAKRRNASQISAPPEVGSIDLGLVTARQHKQLTDKSRKGKRKA